MKTSFFTIFIFVLCTSCAPRTSNKPMYDIRIMLEESSHFGVGKHTYVKGRQEAIKVIKIAY